MTRKSKANSSVEINLDILLKFSKWILSLIVDEIVVLWHENLMAYIPNW